MDEVHGNIAVNKMATDGEQRGAKDGKKRARKELGPKEERENKRVKVDKGSSDKTVKISIKKVPKPKEKRGQQRKATENSTPLIGSKWNVLQPIRTRAPPKATQSQEQPSLTELKPRIWTSRRTRGAPTRLGWPGLSQWCFLVNV
ncbi:hypothetical protein BYT27DRAFT_6611477 [Phlegmacium glaucopus]|nr:hypothetical protein BYT27DRAFT_6611477 [Phlegmacium glaucopus]